jgi:hypothetical protein
MRAGGVNTEVVGKAKAKRRTFTTESGEQVTEEEREIELYDRAGADFDRILDRTLGEPTQPVQQEGEVRLLDEA